MTRIARAAALALLTAVALTGCIRYNVDMTVSSDNTTSGTVVIAVQKGIGEQAGLGSDEEALSQLFSSEDFGEGFEASDYAEGDWIGQSYTFKDLTFDQLGDFGDLFTLSRDGDTIVLQGDQAPTAEEDMTEMPPGAEGTLSVTFPGKVSSHNGTLEGNTVTWNLFTTTEPLHAEAAATSSSGTNLIVLIAGGVLLLLVVAAGAFFVIRKSRGKAADAPVTDAPVAYSPVADAPASDAPAAETAPTEAAPDSEADTNE